MEQRRTPLAWVESPLQMLGAAEYAATQVFPGELAPMAKLRRVPA